MVEDDGEFPSIHQLDCNVTRLAAVRGALDRDNAKARAKSAEEELETNHRTMWRKIPAGFQQPTKVLRAMSGHLLAEP